eukprot:m.202262 g.202262  ORF g.202262 m.202262 type:complete len:376 (+) comp21713_c0_seq1:31-1158(+)
MTLRRQRQRPVACRMFLTAAILFAVLGTSSQTMSDPRSSVHGAHERGVLHRRQMSLPPHGLLHQTTSAASSTASVLPLALAVPVSVNNACRDLPRLVRLSIRRQTVPPSRVVIGLSVVTSHIPESVLACLTAARRRAHPVNLTWVVATRTKPCAANSRNVALAELRAHLPVGHGVAMQDADDFLHPQWLEFAGWALTHHPMVGAMVGSYIHSAADCATNGHSPFCRMDPALFANVFTSTDLTVRQCSPKGQRAIVHGGGPADRCGYLKVDEAVRATCRHATANTRIPGEWLHCGAFHNAVPVLRSVDILNTVEYDPWLFPSEDRQFVHDVRQAGHVVMYTHFPALCYKCDAIGDVHADWNRLESSPQTCGCRGHG